MQEPKRQRIELDEISQTENDLKRDFKQIQKENYELAHYTSLWAAYGDLCFARVTVAKLQNAKSNAAYSNLKELFEEMEELYAITKRGFLHRRETAMRRILTKYRFMMTAGLREFSFPELGAEFERPVAIRLRFNVSEFYCPVDELQFYQPKQSLKVVPDKHQRAADECLTKLLIYFQRRYEERTKFRQWRLLCGPETEDDRFFGSIDNRQPDELFTYREGEKTSSVFFFLCDSVLRLPKSGGWITQNSNFQFHTLEYVSGKDLDKYRRRIDVLRKPCLKDAGPEEEPETHQTVIDDTFSVLFSKIPVLPRTPMQFLCTFLMVALDCDSPILEALFLNSTPEADLAEKFVYGIMPDEKLECWHPEV